MDVEVRLKDKTTKTLNLGQIPKGSVFYFASLSYEDAIKEDAVYFVVSGGKDSRVQIANLKDGLLLMRDESHRVIKLNFSIAVDTP